MKIKSIFEWFQCRIGWHDTRVCSVEDVTHEKNVPDQKYDVNTELHYVCVRRSKCFEGHWDYVVTKVPWDTTKPLKTTPFGVN